VLREKAVEAMEEPDWSSSPSLDDPSIDDNEPDTAPALDEQLAGKRGIESLRKAIAELPPRYRDVLVLVEIAELSYAEAALICECELNTVRSRLFRARALLVRRLGWARRRIPSRPPALASGPFGRSPPRNRPHPRNDHDNRTRPAARLAPGICGVACATRTRR
jgi:hypothetical protein